MNDKRRIIESADPRPLKWIQTSDYVKWLKSDDRLFWFDGKPGSGKSTLMKHLTTTALTRDALPKDGLRWYVTWFFFDFRSGETIANTPEGMLRAILSQWVNRDPDVAKVLHEENADLLSDDLNVSVLLDRFALASHNAQSRLCIFIDGLNECRSPLADLMDMIMRLKDYTYSKICLASRPYPTIKEVLCSSPRICLEDHNSQTIKLHLQSVVNRLEDSLLCICPPALIELIVKKAAGIILRARFALEQMLKGCRLGEDVSTLMTRCSELPAEVNDMFEKSLQRIPKIFCVKAACYLLLIDSSKSPVSTAELQALGRTLEAKYPDKVQIPRNLAIDQFGRRLLVLLGSLVNVTLLDGINLIRSLTKRGGLTTTCPQAVNVVKTKLQLQTVTSVHETFHSYLQNSSWYLGYLEPVFNGYNLLRQQILFCPHIQHLFCKCWTTPNSGS